MTVHVQIKGKKKKNDGQRMWGGERSRAGKEPQERARW